MATPLLCALSRFCVTAKDHAGVRSLVGGPIPVHFSSGTEFDAQASNNDHVRVQRGAITLGGVGGGDEVGTGVITICAVVNRAAGCQAGRHGLGRIPAAVTVCVPVKWRRHFFTAAIGWACVHRRDGVFVLVVALVKRESCRELGEQAACMNGVSLESAPACASVDIVTSSSCAAHHSKRTSLHVTNCLARVPSLPLLSTNVALQPIERPICHAATPQGGQHRARPESVEQPARDEEGAPEISISGRQPSDGVLVACNTAL